MRRAAVIDDPRPLPPVLLEDQDGELFDLQTYRGKIVLLEFIYTRCPDICTVLATSFEDIRKHVAGSDLDGHVVLLSVSFDPAQDGPAELAEYAERFGGAGDGWRFARPRDPQQLRALLEVCGIIVRPDEYGGYVHNAAIHIIDGDGRLAHIFDADATNETIAELEGRAG